MEHKIEQSVQVYLLWDSEQQQWRIDPVTVDGYDLDSALPGERGALSTECECRDEDACREQVARADAAPLPTGQQLLSMLAVAVQRSRI